jgi:hypothetical protein
MGHFEMNTVMIILAVIFLVAAILVGSFTENTWRNTAITWGLLSVGAVLFGFVLTL